MLVREPAPIGPEEDATLPHVSYAVEELDIGQPSAAACVVVVESRPGAAGDIRRVLPQAWEVQLFSSLDELDGVRLLPGRPLVIVLGPSQVGAGSLHRVGPMLRATVGTGAVMVIEQASSALMREALRAGVHDAVEAAELAEELVPAILDLSQRLAEDLRRADMSRAPSKTPEREHAYVTSVFSPKGGAGKSVVAVNLAVALALQRGEPVALVDLDLQFGDAALMLRLQPVHTFSDALSAGELLDEPLLRSFMVRHEKSGVHVLAAPTSPSELDQVDPGAMLRVLEILRGTFAHVVIDTPAYLSEIVLQALAASDTVAFLVAMDVPSVKNARLGLQAFELLQLPATKVALVLNRAGSKVHLAEHDVERALGMKVDVSLPSELAVPQSVNQGVPAVLAYPRSRFALQIGQFADLVVARTMASARAGSGEP